MELYGVFSRNSVAENKKVLMAVEDDKGRNISDSIDSISASMDKLVVSNMTQLTSAQCESLKCGDIVLKEDSTGQHAYLVSFKKDKVGMCITYTDASCVETVSYDYTEGEWVYNSTDIANLS